MKTKVRKELLCRFRSRRDSNLDASTVARVKKEFGSTVLSQNCSKDRAGRRLKRSVNDDNLEIKQLQLGWMAG